MKPQFRLILASLIFISITTSECKKHKPGNPVDQLPPETQIGANTFGCLIDGKVFLPKGRGGVNPILTSYCQYIFTDYSKGYFFQVSANDFSNPNQTYSVTINTDSIPVSVGTRILTSPTIKGEASGRYLYIDPNFQLHDYRTSTPYQGELIIKKFDEINQIASGTFWFNAVNATGDTVHVTDGRFDMQFTK